VRPGAPYCVALSRINLQNPGEMKMATASVPPTAFKIARISSSPTAADARTKESIQVVRLVWIVFSFGTCDTNLRSAAVAYPGRAQKTGMRNTSS
jgi:hypothetical protein